MAFPSPYLTYFHRPYLPAMEPRSCGWTACNTPKHLALSRYLRQSRSSLQGTVWHCTTILRQRKRIEVSRLSSSSRSSPHRASRSVKGYFLNKCSGPLQLCGVVAALFALHSSIEPVIHGDIKAVRDSPTPYKLNHFVWTSF